MIKVKRRLLLQIMKENNLLLWSQNYWETQSQKLSGVFRSCAWCSWCEMVKSNKTGCCCVAVQIIKDSGYNVKCETMNLEEIVTGGPATWLELLVFHSALCHPSLWQENTDPKGKLWSTVGIYDIHDQVKKNRSTGDWEQPAVLIY